MFLLNFFINYTIVSFEKAAVGETSTFINERRFPKKHFKLKFCTTHDEKYITASKKLPACLRRNTITNLVLLK